MFPHAAPSAPFETEQSSVYRRCSPTAPVPNVHSLLAAMTTGQWPSIHSETGSDVVMQALLAKDLAKPSFTNSNTNTPRIVDADPLQQSKTELMLIKEAIEKEKNRLVGSIIKQYTQAATAVRQPQPPVLARLTHTHQLQSQPTVIPSATSLVDHIGSQVRVGHGYVDVTQLVGIDEAEAVKARANRGGNIETFPEVSAKQSTITSLTTLTHHNHHHFPKSFRNSIEC
jgi:hypothetical protein